MSELLIWESFFLWGAVFNFGILLLWFLMLALGGDLFYRLQTKWFPMSRENFVMIHYVMYGLFKLGIILFFVSPWVAIQILK